MRAVARALLAVVLYLAFLGGMLPETLSVMSKTEMAGATAQVAKLADQIAPDGVVLFAGADPMGLAAQLAIPLQFIYGRDSLLLLGAADSERLGQLIRGWEAAGRKVYVVAPDDGEAAFAPSGIAFTPVGAASLEMPTLEAPFDRPPTEWLTYRSAVDIFETGAAGAAQVTLGQGDALNIAGGWYGRETGSDGPFRWTNGDAAVRLPWPTAARAVTLRLAGPGTSATPVDVSVNGTSIGRVNAAPGMADYRLPLPADLAPSDAAVVRLSSPTFTPGGGDPRRLGVPVSRIGLE